MTGWHWGPMLGFDIESTGIDVEEDRIVQVGLANIPHPATPEVRTILVNPMVDIPESASAIHGITTETVIQHGEVAAEVIELVETALYAAWASDIPVVIFNAVYDLTIFDRELQRHHGRGLEIAGPVLDPLVMINALTAWKRGHNLDRACETYQIPLLRAHDAGQDALATTRLLWRLASTLRAAVTPVDRGVPQGLHGRGVKPDDPETKIDLMDLGEIPLDVLMRMQTRWFRSSVEGFVENQRGKGRDPVVNWQWPMIKKLEAVR